MSTIFCQKLQKEGTQLTRKPLAGELGERIYQNICQEAWDMWLKQQTMLINEHRLSSLEAETQKFLRQKMEEFLFENQNITPKEY